MCSSTAAAFQWWVKRFLRGVDISVWLALSDSVGCKVRHKWVLYKFCLVLETQAIAKA